MNNQTKQPFIDEKIHAFSDYMETLRSEGGCVRFSDINLMDIYKISSNAYIFDINHETGEWIMRFFGTQLVQDFGQDLTGKDIHAVIQGDTKDSILESLIRVIEKEKPVWTMNTVMSVPDKTSYSREPKTVAYERLAYPLYNAANRVDHVIGLAIIYPYSGKQYPSQTIELP